MPQAKHDPELYLALRQVESAQRMRRGEIPLRLLPTACEFVRALFRIREVLETERSSFQVRNRLPF